MIRGQLAEFGIVLAKGIHHVLNLVTRLLDGETLGIPLSLPKIPSGADSPRLEGI
jgi:hypothetical protein